MKISGNFPYFSPALQTIAFLRVFFIKLRKKRIYGRHRLPYILPSIKLSSVSSSLSEALAAENVFTFSGLKGHLTLSTAILANCAEHLSCTLLCILLCGTALLASGGLVLESSLSVELLLTCGEHEIVSAISAL